MSPWNNKEISDGGTTSNAAWPSFLTSCNQP